MKICITSQGDKLDAKVEARFGRSPYYIIYDSETSDFEAIKNPNVDASGGAGVQSAQMIVDKDSAVILTGNQPGPKAAKIIEAAGIKVITNLSGTVKSVVDRYQAGDFSSTETVASNAVAEAAQQKSIESSENWFGRCVRSCFGRGKCQNAGQGQGRGGRGFGQGGGVGKKGQGASDYCVCPKCGEKVAHQRGVPCTSVSCPKCSTKMVRE